MKRSLICFAICLTALLGLIPGDLARAQRAPLVLAFYYNWFDENTWKPERVPDFPAERYVSRDAGAMARQISQAKNAGIDAFIVSWWGAGNPTDENFKVMLDQARAANFRAAVDFELTSPFYHSKDDAIKSLKNLLATHTQHPAYLRADGKPVIFFWREQKYSVDEWRAIRDTVDPNRQSLWIAEGLDTSYLRVFDGFHLYSIGWASNVAAELQKWHPRVDTFGADKIWVATVMPGNDDRKTRRAGSYVRDRRNGEFYRETWRAAFSTSPDWIIITSWNEWVEGTMIEPSVTYGNLYLDITREFSVQFHAGLPAPTPTLTRAPKPTATATVLATRLPTASPEPTQAHLLTAGMSVITTDRLRVRAAPGTGGEILGYLREGATTDLLIASEDGKWWQIVYPSGALRGWISAEFIKPAPNAEPTPSVLAVVPTPTSEPTALPTLTPALVSESPTPEATATPTPLPTSTPASLFPSLRSIFSFLP